MSEERYFKFSVFHPAGVQVYFGGDAESDDAALAQKALAAVSAALAAGFSATLPGLEAGEKVERVTGWVLGETSAGEPCVYLYGPAQLKYRVATVWSEDVERLPFAVDTDAPAWPGAAPERRVAENKGAFHAHDFEIVLRESGKTEDGKARWRFDRVHGAGPSVEVKNSASGNGSVPAANGSGSADAATRFWKLALAAGLSRDEGLAVLRECGGDLDRAFALLQAQQPPETGG